MRPRLTNQPDLRSHRRRELFFVRSFGRRGTPFLRRVRHPHAARRGRGCGDRLPVVLRGGAGRAPILWRLWVCGGRGRRVSGRSRPAVGSARLRAGRHRSTVRRGACRASERHRARAAAIVHTARAVHFVRGFARSARTHLRRLRRVSSAAFAVRPRGGSAAASVGPRCRVPRPVVRPAPPRLQDASGARSVRGAASSRASDRPRSPGACATTCNVAARAPPQRWRGKSNGFV